MPSQILDKHVVRETAAGALISEFGASLYHGCEGPRCLLMIDIYLDDSGTHGGPHCFLAGYIASTERWANFSDRWNPLCQTYLNGAAFKGSAANQYVSERGMIEFAQCIVDHVEVEVWAALPEFYAAKIQREYGIRFDPYRICVIGALEAVVNDINLLEREDLLAWIFDHHGGTPADEESVLETSLMRGFNDFARTADAAHRRLLNSIAFANDETVLPLQAADFLAWHKRRRQVDGPDVPERSAYKILREAKMKRIEVVWFDHKLEDFLERLTRPH